MEEVEHVAKKCRLMEEVDQLSTSSDPLLTCCMCRRLLHEAVQLKCLHNCCRPCFRSAASAVDGHDVSCVACGAITQAGSEKLNGFIDGQVRRYRAIAASRVCGVCKGTDELDNPALMWCTTCRQWLCGDCVAGHRDVNSQHVTQSLEELSSQDEFCAQPSASVCAIHQKPLDIACRNCEEVKCANCGAECNEKMHELLNVGKESFNIYVGGIISSIASVESELLRKSEVLEKPRSIVQDTKAIRDRHLEEIEMRKRRVVDAVEMVYQEIATSTKNMYDELVSERAAAATVADRLDADLSDARNYIRRLEQSDDKCVIINQQKIVRERLNVLSAELDSLSDRLSRPMREVSVEALLPDDVEDVVRTWIGMPHVYAAPSPPAPSQLPQSFSFGDASAAFRLPVHCGGVALTQDGRSLLFAAYKHGLIELCSASGSELSRWRPPIPGCHYEEEVDAVAALSDGRVAVSVCYAQLIVLLRRNGRGAEAWTEDRQLVDQPEFSPCLLSAHGDVLAMAYHETLQLLSLSSGRRLSETKRDYGICVVLAVAARMVVTGSSDKVELGGRRRLAAHVLDAHRLDADGGDERLWRHALRSNSRMHEELRGVCADSSGGCLYAAVGWSSEQQSARVSVLSLADGSELRRVALRFPAARAAAQPRCLLPCDLSLCVDRAASAAEQLSSGGRVLLLAVLCWDSLSEKIKIVTLHRSTSDTLQ